MVGHTCVHIPQINWFRPKHCDDILATNLGSASRAGYAFAHTHRHHAHGLPYLCLARDLDRLV